MNPDLRTVALGERSYDVFFSPHAWPLLSEWLTRTFPGRTVFAVTDEKVLSLYEDELEGALSAIPHHVLALPAGEEHKGLDSVRRAWSFLSEKGADRGAVILAFGGGVVGDLAGFAASTWLRGVPCVQLPTTLLAQVDSSVGGKTGFNLPEGKNLVGTFHQPRAVFVDPTFLRTLDGRNLAAGYAEVVKCALAGDPALWESVSSAGGRWRSFDGDQWQGAIRASVDFKARLVESDEREEGERKLLNLGHTVGHAFEQAGEYRRMLHGEAVALGLCWEALLSRRLGVASAETEEAIFAVLREAGYVLDDPAIPLGALSAALGMDKKRAGAELVLPLVDEPGKCLLMSVPVSRVRDELSAIRATLKERLQRGAAPEREPRESVVGDPARVVSELEAAVTADPRDVRALRLLADAYRKAGRVQAAWETVKEALARDPSHGGSQALAREIRALLDEEGAPAAPEATPSILEGTLVLEDEVIEIGPAEPVAAEEAPSLPAAPRRSAVDDGTPAELLEPVGEPSLPAAPHPVRTVTMATLYWNQGNRETAESIVREILSASPEDGRARGWLAERSLPVPPPPGGGAAPVEAAGATPPPAETAPEAATPHGTAAPEDGREGRKARGSDRPSRLAGFLRKITKEYGHEIP